MHAAISRLRGGGGVSRGLYYAERWQNRAFRWHSRRPRFARPPPPLLPRVNANINANIVPLQFAACILRSAKCTSQTVVRAPTCGALRGGGQCAPTTTAKQVEFFLALGEFRPTDNCILEI